jgi:hypothetical protein
MVRFLFGLASWQVTAFQFLTLSGSISTPPFVEGWPGLSLLLLSLIISLIFIRPLFKENYEAKK